MTTADILAAARAGKSAVAKPAAEPTAPATGTAPPKPARTDKSKMTTAEILAAARRQSTKIEASPPPPAADMSTPVDLAASHSTQETVDKPPSEPLPAEEAPQTTKATAPGGTASKRKEGMSVADILAYCRRIDTKK